MDQQQQPRRRPIGRWILCTGGIVLALAFVVSLYGGYRYGWKYTVILKDPDFNKRTFWDWLKLLIVPAVLALGGYLFTRSENRRTQDIAEQQRALDQELTDQRTNEDRKLADEHRQDALLQAYLDQMGQLLLHEDRPLRKSKEEDEMRTLARARTLTALSRLDGSRKRSVLQFLYETDLITRDRAVVDLTGAHLEEADLHNAKLLRANLRGTDLHDARLGLGDFGGSDLRDADLEGADLEATNLCEADLRRATLLEASLYYAVLSGANLQGANLRKARLALEVFRCFFEQIVELCIEGGLVWGKEQYFDSTKVEANADVDSLRSRSIAQNHLEELFEGTGGPEKTEEFATPPRSPDASATDALATAGDEGLEENDAQKNSKDWISRAGKQDRSFSSGPHKRTADRLVSTTDPDATPMRLGSGGQTKLGYQAHYVVDGGRARVILNVLVTPSEVSENRPMLDLLWRTAFRWGLRPHQVTGDAKYGTRQNVAALEKAGIRAYVAIPNFDFRHTGLFGTGHFRYDPEKDLYVCPADEHLHRHARTSGDRGTRYRAKLQACNACELKKRCTDSEKGRIIYRRPDEDYYERVRAYRGSFPYEKALRKRRVWVEPLFAEARGHQHLCTRT